jgi:arabinogalactan oligomer/maltooligosaccharide transport system permease protein
LGRLDAERSSGAALVATEVQRQVALLRSASAAAGLPALVPAQPSALDADAYRRPRALLTPDGAVDAQKLAAAGRDDDASLALSLLAADLLSLAVLLMVGLGGLGALGETLRRNRQAYAYIAPAIFGMLVLVFFPFFYGITLSFTDSNLYNTGQPLSEIWIGLRNYAAILGDFAILKPGEGGSSINYLNFYWTLLFTVIWTVTNVTFGVTTGLVLALILNTKKLMLRPFYRVLLILPWALPNYITALIWKGMFHRQFGVINHVIEMFGGHPFSWFDRPFTSFLTALATNGWLSFPFMMVVSLGALQSIPADLYEAARVDGANRWQQFRAITLPSLRPSLVPAVIISVVWTFNMFNIIYLVTAGEPGGATEILVTQAYKFAFERYRYGYGAAYSTVIFGILLVYGTFQNRVSRATEA